MELVTIIDWSISVGLDKAQAGIIFLKLIFPNWIQRSNEIRKWAKVHFSIVSNVDGFFNSFSIRFLNLLFVTYRLIHDTCEIFFVPRKWIEASERIYRTSRGLSYISPLYWNFPWNKNKTCWIIFIFFLIKIIEKTCPISRTINFC